MYRIVVNQLRQNALLLFTVFLVSNAFYLFLARMHGMLTFGIPGGIQVAIATTSVMVLGLFLREEQGKGQVILRSLPLPHAKVVSGMYVLVAVILLLNLAYGLSVQLLNAHIGPWVPERLRSLAIDRLFTQFDPGYAFEHSVLARAIALVAVVSVSIPLIVRFGTMWRILFGYLLVFLAWTRAVDYLLDFSLQRSLFLGLSRWIFFATVLMIISLSLSWKLSVWMYGQREL